MADAPPTSRIRLATEEDAPAIAAIYRPAVTDSPTSFELEPPHDEEMARRIRHITERLPWLVCETGRGVAGYAYATVHRERPAYRWSVEVSAYVHPHHQRAGVGRALYTSLFAVLGLQGFRNAYAGITLPNPASVGLHTAVGFTPIGVFHRIGYKFGDWHDVGWFERPLLPHVIDPEPPIPLSELDSRELAAPIGAGQGLLR